MLHYRKGKRCSIWKWLNPRLPGSIRYKMAVHMAEASLAKMVIYIILRSVWMYMNHMQIRLRYVLRSPRPATRGEIARPNKHTDDVKQA